MRMTNGLRFFSPQALAPTLVLALVLAGAGAPAGAGSGTEMNAAAAAALIVPEALRDSVETLAAPEMEGRNTPNKGLDRAAEFLADEMEKAGLRPLGDDGTFFHKYPLECLTVDPKTSLTISLPGEEERTLEIGKDFMPIRGSDESEAEGEIAFVGYAIDSREEKYDDFGNKSIRGKVALCFWHEPREKSKGKVFDGPQSTKWSSFEEKAKAVKERGAVALLVVTDPVNHDEDEEGPIAFQFPFYTSANPHEQKAESAGIPMAHVSLEVAEALAGKPLEPVQKSLDASLRGKPFVAANRSARLSVRFKTEPVVTQNVVGYWPGGDEPLAQEAIVISAHYDHIGRDSRGDVFHGADDDGSGTAAVLEVARTWAASGIRPPRGVIFAFFSAEEKGLIGSKEYVARPPFPLARTVANLNMDMIGRNDRGKINAVGKIQNESLWDIAARAGKRPDVGIRVEDEGNEFFNRSDHYNFYKNGVPFLFFFSGMHEDYHRITDTPDKVDAKKVAQMARLVFYTSHDLAMSDVRPKIKGD